MFLFTHRELVAKSIVTNTLTEALLIPELVTKSIVTNTLTDAGTVQNAVVQSAVVPSARPRNCETV